MLYSWNLLILALLLGNMYLFPHVLIIHFFLVLFFLCSAQYYSMLWMYHNLFIHSPTEGYGCESWTIKKAEHWRIDAFELWCWRRLLVPQKARRSILNTHWKDWYWSWNSNTLATWCEELTHLKRPWCWESMKAGGEGDDRGWDGWMASLTQWTWVWVSSGSWWWTGKPGVLLSMGSQSQTQLSDWTDLTELKYILSVLAAQSCPILSNPMDWSPPDSSVHGILQARMLEWVAIFFSRGSSWPRDSTWVPWITGRFFIIWTTREAGRVSWLLPIRQLQIKLL